MTLQELYQAIDGSYEQAQKVLRMDKLIDKHIRKLPANTIFASLIAAGESLDPTALFENAHAVKGVCANLGLVKMSQAASEISEEFRPGNSRRMTDDEVREKLEEIKRMYETAKEEIEKYSQSV